MLLAAVLVPALLIAGCSDSDKRKKPSVQTIAVLRPPPPPPPPKPEEKPPEPEIKKEEVRLPEPDQKPEAADEPPPGEQLGVDAEGGAGNDGFGLVGKPGGRDITTIGEGGGGGGRAQFNAYAGLVQVRLQEQLQKRDRLRQSDYRAVVRIWFTERGGIDRVEVVDGTGDAEIDSAIRSALLDVRSIDQAPPEGMPQPLKLKLTSRGAG
jgi:protein TonB